ncbi:hypothetical protein LINPERPRIM_LOCUS16843 [Linum perenne]
MCFGPTTNGTAHPEVNPSANSVAIHDNSSDDDNGSSYRGSEGSAHIRGNISDDNGFEDIYDCAPIYNLRCDHKEL